MRRAMLLSGRGCSEFVTRTFTLRELKKDIVLVIELELILLNEEPEE